MQRCKLKICFALAFAANFFTLSVSEAQDTSVAVGGVEKYDKSFDGIGPKVYVLPKPRSKAELLAELYTEKLYFRDSISKALELQNLIEEFKPTENNAYIQYLLQPQPEDDTQWEQRIKQQADEKNYYTVYGLLHNLAGSKLLNGETDKALMLLHSALHAALQTKEAPDIATIQANLASVYLFKKDLEQAMTFQEAYYAEAVKRKNIVEQAASLIKIAHIQAQGGEYHAAENAIIRKAIPMLNRAKAYGNKVYAWQVLAKIYHLQDKHTEAQWFLIQARDLAVKHKLTGELAEIEYMLAFSKFAQQNFKVAQQEFIKADKLAKSEDNKLLQLAIVDRLGQIYMDDNELLEAQTALDSYLLLRRELFNL